MFQSRFTCAVLAGILMLGSRAFAGELIKGSDPRATPLKDAVVLLVKAIDAGDMEKAKSAYAGTGDDLDLLKAYVDGVAAAKAMRSAMKSKFGDLKEPPAGLDTAFARTAIGDFNSVIFLDDPDRASTSADTPLGVGIEFKRVAGTWKVLSLASAPNTAERHLARLKKYIATVGAITEKLKTGGYHSAEEAARAAEEAEAGLWPRGR